MKDSANRIFAPTAGIVLIVAAVAWMLDILDIINLGFLFFRGWWTLLLIIPCTVSFIQGHDRNGSLIGIALGVLLLLGVRGVIDWTVFWKMMLASIILVIGLGLLFKDSICGRKDKFDSRFIERDGLNIHRYEVSFGERTVQAGGETFEGIDIKASFASLTLDLRNAVLKDGCVIRLDCNFAGLEILLPDNVRIEVSANAVFGAIEDKRKILHTDLAPLVHIEGNCSFAGVDII